MCVVSHDYDCIGGGNDGGGRWYVCGAKAGELIACREMQEHFPNARLYTDDTRSYRGPGAQLWVGPCRNS